MISHENEEEEDLIMRKWNYQISWGKNIIAMKFIFGFMWQTLLALIIHNSANLEIGSYRRIQNPVERLRWSFLQKQLPAESR